jgi:hypothetical protein
MFHSYSLKICALKIIKIVAQKYISLSSLMSQTVFFPPFFRYKSLFALCELVSAIYKAILNQQAYFGRL